MAADLAADMAHARLSSSGPSMRGNGNRKPDSPDVDIIKADTSDDDDERKPHDDEQDDDDQDDDDEPDGEDRPPHLRQEGTTAVAPAAFEGGRLASMRGGNHQQPWIAGCTDTPTERIVLGQLAYWFRPNHSGRVRADARYFHGGYHWIFQRYSELARRTQLSRKQVGHAMRSLIVRGIVVERPHRTQDRLLRLDGTRIEELLAERNWQEPI